MNKLDKFKDIVESMPTGTGVYLMKDSDRQALYVGKALNLRKRVGSYFDARPKGARIMRMVSTMFRRLPTWP